MSPEERALLRAVVADPDDDTLRLAYADSVGGPWKVHEPGVLHVRDTALFRPQPDSARFGGFNTHLASPEIFVDAARKRIVLWAHGWWTNNEQWPAQPAAAQRWADEKGYGQFTQSAVSSDGRVKQRLSATAGDVREPSWGPFID